MIVYPTAILLDALLATRAGAQDFLASLKRFGPSFAVLVLGALAYVGVQAAFRRAPGQRSGSLRHRWQVEYELTDVARWFVWHAGELAFSVGIFPALAFGVLFAAGASPRESCPTAGERAFVAVTLATTFWFVLQAAAFASRFTGRIEERYMVYAAPLLLMGLASGWPAGSRARSFRRSSPRSC